MFFQIPVEVDKDHVEKEGEKRHNNEVLDDNDDDDDDDELTLAVLKVQNHFFNQSNQQEEKEKCYNQKEDLEPNFNQEIKDNNDRTVIDDKEGKDSDHNVKLRVQLPSVSEAFSNLTTEFLREQTNPNSVEKHLPGALDRVLAKRSNTSVSSEPAITSATTIGLPDEGYWHVPLTFVDVVKLKKKTEIDEKNRKAREIEKKNREAHMIKKRIVSEVDNEEKKMTVKEREKVKRMKGQGGSQQTWKPEAWMKLRQEFD